MGYPDRPPKMFKGILTYEDPKGDTWIITKHKGKGNQRNKTAYFFRAELQDQDFEESYVDHQLMTLLEKIDELEDVNNDAGS